MSWPSYRVDKPLHAKKKSYHFFSLFLVFVVIVVLAVVFIGYSKLNDQNKDATGSKKGKTFRESFAGPTLFKSKYFEFSDTNNWMFAANDSTATKFTYLLDQDGVPARSITVYVNQTPLNNDLATTRVLPVSIVNGESFDVGDVSVPCSTLYSATDKQVIKTVSMLSTSFLCVPDSPEYTISVGQIGGNYNLRMNQSNGQPLNYIIQYHDLSVDPDAAPFMDFMKSFKSI